MSWKWQNVKSRDFQDEQHNCKEWGIKWAGSAQSLWKGRPALVSNSAGNWFRKGSLRSVLKKVMLPVLSLRASNIKTAGVRHRERGVIWQVDGSYFVRRRRQIPHSWPDEACILLPNHSSGSIWLLQSVLRFAFWFFSPKGSYVKALVLNLCSS